MTASTRSLVAALALAAATLPAAGAQAATAAPVSVYPSPGARTASPATQLSFRGVAPGATGPIEVTGSRSGPHGGTWQGHSDGDGASFLPAHPFVGGETVSVRTTLAVRGAHDGDFRLTIATPGPPLKAPPTTPKQVLDGAVVQRFHSRHDLVPPRVTVSRSARGTAPGSVFLGTFASPGLQGSGQIGPMILDAQGRLQWFHPLPAGQLALDVRVQAYEGKPVLTWWQGFNNRGLGDGVGVIFDRSYRQIATVHAGNGMQADPHELLLTPRGTALLTAENPVVQDLSSVHGAKRAVVWDSVVQEIDVKTGLVEFEWHSLDHVGAAESYARPVTVDGHLYDYFHINSVDRLGDGDLLVSGRNTWGIYKVDRATGAVDWRLGGKRSTFAQAKGSTFAWQHDARVQRDGTITVFDDGASPAVHTQSHGIGIRLDTHRRSARLVHDYRHAPKILANSQGNVQSLPNGDVFVGWGSAPTFSEYAAHGALLFDASLPAGTESYRAYRLPWDPDPQTTPAVAASSDGNGTTAVYASWNGAADVAAWRVLAGADASHLSPVASARSRGFETAIRVHGAQPFVAVQARDAHGTVLATSGAIAPQR